MTIVRRPTCGGRLLIRIDPFKTGPYKKKAEAYASAFLLYGIQEKLPSERYYISPAARAHRYFAPSTLTGSCVVYGYATIPRS